MLSLSLWRHLFTHRFVNRAKIIWGRLFHPALARHLRVPASPILIWRCLSGLFLSSLPVSLHPIIERFLLLTSNDLFVEVLIILPFQEGITGLKQALAEVLGVSLYHLSVLHQVDRTDLLSIGSLWFLLRVLFLLACTQSLDGDDYDPSPWRRGCLLFIILCLRLVPTCVLKRVRVAKVLGYLVQHLLEF